MQVGHSWDPEPTLGHPSLCWPPEQAEEAVTYKAITGHWPNSPRGENAITTQ